MTSYRDFFARLVVMVSAIVLSGCTVLPASETLTVYQLPAASSQTSHTGSTWALRVATPYSSQLINSQRILVQPAGDAISVYQGVRWSDVAPVMWRDYLVDVLRVQAPNLIVTNDTSGALYDLALTSDLSRFQVVYGPNGPVVQIQLDASLIGADSKRTVATRRFAVEQTIDGTQVPQVVAAFGVAANTLAVQLVDWVLMHKPGTQ